MVDLIDRQAAIDALADQLYHSAEDYRTAVKVIGNLPSAQPQLPEWAQKVEEYRKIAPKTFSSPIAWALYQTWMEYAERRTDE